MAMNYDQIMSLALEGIRHDYSDQETILYALGVGMGRNPLNEDELAYVFERGDLKTVPTLATVLTRSSLLRDSGIDYAKVLHGEQRLELHRPLPSAGSLIADSRVVAAYDKGPDKGAVVLTETKVRLAADGEPLFTLGGTIFARGDGGFGGPSGSGPEPHRLPERAPDLVCALETRPDQALLYRLSGDRNPLHADPALAKRVGFPAPILHGLCTYGTACRAVLQTVCGYDHTRIAGFDGRFSSPVYPGETIATEIWVDGKTVSFRARVPARDVTVINNGKCTLR